MVKRKKFPPNTAGGKMISTIPKAKIGQNISQIETMLIKTAKKFKTLDYIYVVNGKNILQGIASIKEILQVPDKRVKIEKIMKKDLVVVHPSTDQERMVYLALKHGIKAIPVVDRGMRLLGVVQYDTILQIFNQEVREDIFRFGGIYHKVGKEFDTLTAPVIKMIKARLPWLVVGIAGGIIAASVVSFFEGILSKYLILTAFIPVLVYMGDAAGTQSETLIVRGVALNPKLSARKWLKRELIVAISLGLFCGAIVGIVGMLGWGGGYLLGSILGVSMFLGILAGIFISTLFPLILKKLNVDPAVASGPFATIVSDIANLVIYFIIASLLLGILD